MVPSASHKTFDSSVVLTRAPRWAMFQAVPANDSAAKLRAATAAFRRRHDHTPTANIPHRLNVHRTSAAHACRSASAPMASRLPGAADDLGGKQPRHREDGQLRVHAEAGGEHGAVGDPQVLDV